MPDRLKARCRTQADRSATLLLWGSLLSLLLLIYDLGFFHATLADHIADTVVAIILLVLTGVALWRLFRIHQGDLADRSHILREALIPGLLAVSAILRIGILERMVGLDYALGEFLVLMAVMLVFFTELSKKSFTIFRRRLNPALLFMGSFAMMILLGAALLLLPAATTNGIHPIDALFTSTSAVCVTGLSVLDTQFGFTRFGQLIILFLIQVGGLGIMTFTSVFAYFFTGKFTFDNQLFLSDLNQEQRFGQIFQMLYRVFQITFLVEFLGGILIWLSLPGDLFTHGGDRLFAALFHTVSAFCNAGFSTFSAGLYEPALRMDYPLHLVVSILIVLGGIGFTILYNTYEYFRYKLRTVMRGKEGRAVHLPWVLNFNSRLVMLATAVLLLAGTLIFLLTERTGVLAVHHGMGRLVEAFFMSVTPRTAGFNTIDMTALAPASIMFVILLMWIGASPGSTGGGIKVSTFTLATLNILGTIRGKNRIEIFRREISNSSLRLSYTVICLSLIIIGLSLFLLSVTDPEASFMALGFEAFSAYSTVGLSLGITSSLSAMGKLVLVLTMFTGRVGAFTILLSLFKQRPYVPYRFPKETVTVS